MESNELEYATGQVNPIGWVIVSYLVGAFNLCVSCGCFFFLLSLVANKGTRTNPYDLYVIFLIFPDGFNTLLVGTKEIFIGMGAGRRFPGSFMEIYSGVFFFYFVGNFYLNAVVTHEVYTLILHSYQRRRKAPPRLSRVFMQVAIIYTFAVLMALWSGLPVAWAITHFVDARHGDGAFGSPEGGVFSKGAALIIFGALVLVPMIYVLFVRARIWWLNLLPRRGRTKALSLFFMRIVIVFVACYVPNVLFVAYALNATDSNSAIYYWLTTASALLSGVQALITLYMISMKENIKYVVSENFRRMRWTHCKPPVDEEEQEKMNRKRSSIVQNSEWNQPDCYDKDVRGSGEDDFSSGWREVSDLNFAVLKGDEIQVNQQLDSPEAGAKVEESPVMEGVHQLSSG